MAYSLPHRQVVDSPAIGLGLVLTAYMGECKSTDPEATVVLFDTGQEIGCTIEKRDGTVVERKVGQTLVTCSYQPAYTAP